MMGKSSNCIDHCFNVDNVVISLEHDVDLLGINIDYKLKFDKHITGLCRKVSAQLAVLNRFKNILSTDVKLKLYNAFIPLICFILTHLN